LVSEKKAQHNIASLLHKVNITTEVSNCFHELLLSSIAYSGEAAGWNYTRSYQIKEIAAIGIILKPEFLVTNHLFETKLLRKDA
jgi:hypothetical protein